MDDAAPAATLIPVPSDDAVLGSLANRVVVETGTRPLALERALRRAFPYVRVQIQHELAQLGSRQAWYVYRDGLYQFERLPEWWRREGLAHGSLDEIGRFVQVDEATARLFGLGPRELVGSTVDRFFAPELRSWFADAMSVIRGRDILETKWLLYRPDGAEKYAEFRFVRQGLAPCWHLAVIGTVPTNWLLVPTLDDERVPQPA
jgi:PAS domain S-box-containing protein